MKAAIYARVSTEEQAEEGYSISAQQRACNDYCQAHGWEVFKEYIDEGKSARVDDIAKRPAFQQMMADALAHRFDLLVVHKIDRFSRNRRVAFESFDKLGRAGVGFLSLSENMDFSAPWGQFALTMMVGLAQLFSDNLSLETKKGKRERKAQGLYNGLLPFGVVKGADGLPIRDERPLENNSTNYAGLLAAFEAASHGATDAEVAKLLNARGYRTTGNRGANLFRKDTVRRMLTNRFYLGDLPDKGAWIPGRHQAMVPAELFGRVQQAREGNRANQAHSVNHVSKTYSLTGLLRCWHCDQSGDSRRGAMRIQSQHSSSPRVICYSRIQGLECPQRSVFLSMYEEQIGRWLGQITLTDGAVESALAQYAAEAKTVGDVAQERARLEARLKRLRDVYTWGDIERGEYLAERDTIAERLRVLAPESERAKDVRQAAEAVRGVCAAWLLASQAERNKLLARMLQRVVVRDAEVVQIVPRPAFAALLPLWQSSSYSGGSDGGRRPASMRYLAPHNMRPAAFLREIAAASGSIRGLAKRYGTSRQTVRKALALAK